jgi:tRNA pseudouridine55 synthase
MQYKTHNQEISNEINPCVIRGVLNVDKPSGISSYDVIRKIKRVVNPAPPWKGGVKVKRLGHAGTLDPMASGVLLVLFNEATKIASFLTELNKEYLAEIRLGIKTDTDDITGKVIEERDVPKLTSTQIKKLLSEFEGEISQTPPVFSALRQQGKRLYNLAREGKTAIPRPRKVFVYEADLIDFISPLLKIRFVVSKGTYIRSLARDIGDRLGCGATLSALTRTKVGSFSIGDALKLDALSCDSIKTHLCSIPQALSNLDTAYIKEDAIKKLVTGQELADSDLINPDFIRLPAPKADPAFACKGGVKVLDSTQKIMAIAQRIDGALKPIRLIYADLPKSQ